MKQLKLTVFNYFMQSCKNMFFLCWLWHHRYIIEDKLYFNYDGSLPPWEYTSTKWPLTKEEKEEELRKPTGMKSEASNYDFLC